MNTETQDPRLAAYLSLMKIRKGGYSNVEVDVSLSRSRLSGEDRNLYTALVYGVTERMITLDWLIGRFGSKKPEDLDPEALTLLRMGIYQLYFTDRIPDHAAVYETVELAKRICQKHSGAPGYVNAVLRASLRGRDNPGWPDEKTDGAFALSIRYSLPLWLTEMWLSDYPDHAAALMEYANSIPRIAVRANTLTLPRSALARMLKDDGIEAEASDAAPYCLILHDTAYPRLKKHGRFLYVQDAASQLAAEAFGAEPGERILDACAAPGGKSFYSAMKLNDAGEIISCDLHENKLRKIEETARRLGVSIITTRRLDARVFDSSLGEFDRVLCDVPCSGLGAIAKKPEIRYKDPGDIAALPKTQRAILDACSGYVKPGGTLMYSTCTVNRAENDGISRAFSEARKDFELTEEKTLFPDTDGCDGFYYAVWKRKS